MASNPSPPEFEGVASRTQVRAVMVFSTINPGDRGSGADWVPVEVFTLPTIEQPLRVAEFDQLFASTLRDARRAGGSAARVRLVLAGGTRRGRGLRAWRGDPKYHRTYLIQPRVVLVTRDRSSYFWAMRTHPGHATVARTEGIGVVLPATKGIRMGRVVRRSRLLRLVLVAMISLTLLVGSGAAVASPRPSPAGEAIHVVKESAVYNPSTGLVKFTLKFDRRPSFDYFVDVDGVLRRPDLFQYFIVGDATLGFPLGWDAIVRVEDPAFASSQLLIRNAVPSSADPAASGWGTIRATVPYRVGGRVLKFSAPLAALSDHSTDGTFTYELEICHNGGLVEHIVNESEVRHH